MWLGDAAKIRRQAKRRQKNDRRDADLILDLLLRVEFPRVPAHSAGSVKKMWLSGPRGRAELFGLPVAAR